MPVDPNIARGYPGGVMNSFLDARNGMENRELVRERNALLDRRYAVDEQRYADERADMQRSQGEAAEKQEMLMLLPGVEAGDESAIKTAIGRIAAKNPAAAQTFLADPSRLAPAMRNVLGIQAPQAAPSLPTLQQDNGYSYLFDEAKGVVPGSVQAPQRAPLPRVPAPSAAPQVKPPAAAPAQYSPKEVSTARAKLTQINVAKQQLANARAKLLAAPSSEVGGPVAGGLATVGVFPKGQEYQAAIDGMRGSITAITRTPGVGAMSDYETRLDQSKFPNFWFDREKTMEQKLQQLEDLLNTMEAGYSEMVGGAPAQNRVRYDAQGNRL
jgi:hypothetical protein